MKSLVSIIIPIFNGERFLDRCLESILSQTYTNFELILVNDGSSDSSLEICQRYVDCDQRICLIDKKNEGVSMARNDGLKKSKGEYVMFVDCDDWLDKKCIEVLFTNMEHYSCDLSIIGYREVGLQSALYKDTSSIKYSHLMTTEMAMVHLFEAIDYFCLCYPWGKLYRRCIIESHHIIFNRDISIGEDRLFLFEYLLNSNSVYCSSEAYYNYLQNPQGAMQSQMNVKYLSCYIGMQIMREKCPTKSVLKALDREFVAMLIRTLPQKTEKTVKKRIYSICNYYLIHPTSVSFRQWAKLLLLNISSRYEYHSLV